MVTIGSCVLTIMMLEWFPAGTLPDTRSYPWAHNDVSTYKKIYNVAKGIESQCIERQAPGWAQLGACPSSEFFCFALLRTVLIDVFRNRR